MVESLPSKQAVAGSNPVSRSTPSLPCHKNSKSGASGFEERGMRLDGKVAIVTGGAAGIGRAICQLFADEGARVVVADIDADGGRETARSIVSAGGSALFVKTDVSREPDVARMVDAAVAEFGTVNTLWSTTRRRSCSARWNRCRTRTGNESWA